MSLLPSRSSCSKSCQSMKRKDSSFSQTSLRLVSRQGQAFVFCSMLLVRSLSSALDAMTYKEWPHKENSETRSMPYVVNILFTSENNYCVIIFLVNEANASCLEVDISSCSRINCIPRFQRAFTLLMKIDLYK